jgi:hypothetical protein
LEKEGCCSCHICPPCSYCVGDTTYCPECGWEFGEEPEPVESSKPKCSGPFPTLSEFLGI